MTRVLPINYVHSGGRTTALVDGRSERDVPFSALINLNELSDYLDGAVDQRYKRYSKSYYNLFLVLEPNLRYNASYSERAREELYATISLTRGLVRKGEKIISANALVDGAN